ncbi:Plasma membrane t-SNARE, secretory vesicle fusion [Lignoscripta atroalba]|nr:Plasma membrane t-SNARE, secretory vesicle fusion [Lignoscripta atroalba]
MAQYGGYNSQGGYGQSNPYDQQGGNPYTQQGGNPYAQQGGNPYAQQASYQGGYGAQQQQGRYDNPYRSEQNGGYVGGNDVELGQMNGQREKPPKPILEELGAISAGIATVGTKFPRIKALQEKALDDPDTNANTQINRELDALSSQTMTMYRNFVERLNKIKKTPMSAGPENAPTVGRVDRELKKAMEEYLKMDSTFQNRLQEQFKRQYRIARPDASEAEVQAAAEDTSGQQVFSQALLQGNRRGQSSSALRAVESRHVAIGKIERQLVEIAELFQQMETLVDQQEAPVAQINQGAEQVQEHVQGANTQLDGAISKARSRNRKKWWCLLIAVIIIIIIVVVVVVVVLVNRK